MKRTMMFHFAPHKQSMFVFSVTFN